MVTKWLDAYCWLEAELDDRRAFGFQMASVGSGTPAEVAQDVRAAVGLHEAEPVRNISGLLEDHGVKLLLLETTRDSFFGLSVGEGDGGPAVVVNTWDRISVERWILHGGARARASAVAPWGVPAGGDGDADEA